MKKLYLVAGEISGDARAAELMQGLLKEKEDLRFSGVGGNKMCSVPGTDHLRNWVDEAAVVGLWEVVKKYAYFRREFERVRGEIAAWQPDAVILIDYPGFNLRLAKALRRKDKALKIIYYVSPQVWAWKRKRIGQMAKILDLMICIFPFEKEMYEKSGLPTVFSGHPIIDDLGPMRGDFERDSELVGLFPGSRRREVEKLFPVMLEAADMIKRERPGTRFVASAASVGLARIMRRQLERSPLMGELDCEIARNRVYELMQRSGSAVIASGTATLEAAFFGLPYCIVYKVAWPTYLAARALMKVEHLGIVNVLAKREVVKEFLQGAATGKNVTKELLRFLESEQARRQTRRELAETIEMLGEAGASQRAAKAIVEVVDARKGAR